MQSLPAASIGLIFTSPPYNLGTTTGGGFPDKMGNYAASAGLSKRGGGGKWGGGPLANGYGKHKDSLPHDDYIAWQNKVLLECFRLLTEKGAIFYNHKPRIMNGKLVAPVAYVPSELLPFIRQEIIWKRSGGINFSPAFYLPTHERILLIAKRAFRLKSKGASGVGDVWTEHQESKNPHPAPFPIGLPARALETTSPSIVLDPFMGSGTTILAAKKAGRPSIGIEIEERFCEMAVKRFQSEGF